MAEQTGHIEKTLEDLRQDLAARLNEARRILSTMNILEEMIGATKTVLGETAPNVQQQNGIVGMSGAVTGQQVRRGSGSLRPDEFLGVSPLDAAKRYISTVGHAVNIEEVADALARGGAAIKGNDWKEKLETSLIRSTFDVVKVQDHTFGLTSFYTDEQLRGLRDTRRAPEPKKKKRGPKPKKAKSKLEQEAENEKTSG